MPMNKIDRVWRWYGFLQIKNSAFQKNFKTKVIQYSVSFLVILFWLQITISHVSMGTRKKFAEPLLYINLMIVYLYLYHE